MSDRTRRTSRLLVDDIDASFEQIVREHATGVTTFVRRIVGDATAADVSQETFVRALRSLRTMETDARIALDVRPWLYTIARHSAYNSFRAMGRRPSTSLDDGVERSSAWMQPDDAATARETSNELREMLDTLPEMQRDAVVLRHVLDLSTRDAALVLDIPQNTLKSHVARGLKALRVALESAAVNHEETQ
jgi:RNA polymerase sigma factor (sigma-70 family)